MKKNNKTKNVKKQGTKQSKNKHFKSIKLIHYVLGGLIILAMIFVATYFGGSEKMNNPIIEMQTSKGLIVIELYPDKAPITVDNFLQYVESGFYEGTIFHRIIPEFMIQGGGFITDGTQKSTRDPIVIESDNGLNNTKGTIAMARTMDPNSATSQFFINLVDNDFLNYGSRDKGYTVFGKVIEGMDIVDKISAVETQSRPMADWPVESITINSVKKR